MNLYAISCLVSLCASIMLFAYVARHSLSSRLNRIFLLLLAASAMWIFQRMLLGVLPTKDLVRWSYVWFSAGVYFMPALLLHFFLILSGASSSIHMNWPWLLLYATGTIRTYESLRGYYTIREFIRQPWGWQPIYATGSLWYTWYNVYMLLCFIGSFVLVFWKFRLSTGELRHRLKLVMYSFFLPIIPGTVTDFILPASGYNVLPPLTPFFMLCWVFSIWFLIRRWNFFEYNLHFDTDSVLDLVNDSFFLLDRHLNIENINCRVTESLGYTLRNIQHRPFSELLNSPNSAFLESDYLVDHELELLTAFGAPITHSISLAKIHNSDNYPIGTIIIARDLTERKKAELQKEQYILELQHALEMINTLKGQLPICAHCKKIRDRNGNWHEIEHYLQSHSSTTFSHGICPDCAAHYYHELESDE